MHNEGEIQLTLMHVDIYKIIILFYFLDDKTIYMVQENEYLHLINDSTNSEDLLFHTVNWSVKSNQNLSVRPWEALYGIGRP